MRQIWPAAIIPLLLFLACSSGPTEIEAELTPSQFFQQAQEASDKGNFKLASHYYRSFQEHYPNESERNLWAMYEIAFIYYKTGDNQSALTLFDKLLGQYAENEAKEDAASYPLGPLILAEKIKARIEDKEKIER
ncbi:MAG TPA: outer membrane protein assembly factor BamD [bacterium]|nr:outer membrane protein assembly factor BamD [bacterium]